MAVGLQSTAYANKVLDHMHRAVASTAPAGNFVKLHTADPGAAATNAASSVTTRPSATFNAAAAGAVTLSNTPTWATWAGTSPETVTHISVWDASTAGTFLYSVTLTASKTVQTGDTLTLTSLSVSLAPLAA
jgi:type IV secretory pathway TrbL component